MLLYVEQPTYSYNIASFKSVQRQSVKYNKKQKKITLACNIGRSRILKTGGIMGLRDKLPAESKGGAPGGGLRSKPHPIPQNGKLNW